jgi:putative tryptophan/tyrosine transport system substrate-binding protein
MRRREFIAGLGGAVAWPLVARAQQAERMRRIGALMVTGESTQDVQGFVLTFEQQLNSLGWSKGRNLRVDYRWGAADPERIRDYATELINLSPDVLLAFGTPSLVQLRKQTSTIPIVFTVVSDPIGQGLLRALHSQVAT